MIAPAIIKYIKEEWNFSKRLTLVALDPQGRVSPNALNMLWIWGNLAFPFTREKEETLWKAETWGLELLLDGIDSTTLNWIQERRVICMYGGEDIEWIRKFTSMAKAVATEAGIPFGMFYVGKSNAKERMQKMIATFGVEKLQYGKGVENDDHIRNEVMTVLTFDGSDQGWAIFSRGPNEMIRCRVDTAVDTLAQFKNWQGDVETLGFVLAFGKYHTTLQSPHHCNRLILPGSTGGIPEQVVCAECGRHMEKYFMYRCCVE
ncbi:protein SIEVE ELEMENT OCCLUSION B-like [Quillaja saponaria]|uniref:Protein SIEVE ELEMENT OCCLUSION B-like n=1 Tax=Quillaja saponaria TaxID=32244 RepID=A0AAD7LDI6_QUISA|nr:protein SIEVE ELEMENT OCCLUSION B-like [Quillaja saponaria]